MTKRLLDRQVSLLELPDQRRRHLRRRRRRRLDRGLQGIDRGLLDLEARFSHEKRMEKIVAVFPRTFALLGASRETLIERVRRGLSAGRHQPDRERAAIPRLSRRALAARAAGAAVSARCRGLRARTCDRTPHGVRTGRRDRCRQCHLTARQRIRRRPAVVLLRCAYDIRPIFEDASAPRSRWSARRCSRSSPARLPAQPQDLRTRPGGVRLARRRSTIGPIGRARWLAGGRRADRPSSRTPASSRCAGENLHHRQVSADPGRRQHADLLDRARRSRRAVTRFTSSPTPRRCAPPFRMHMRAEDWERCERDFGAGSVTVHWTDPVDRSQSYIPMASPFVSKLAEHCRQRPFRSGRST